jgi:hypothetical protein
MRCPICNHENKSKLSLEKVDERGVHRANECDFCNCGQSDIVHLTGGHKGTPFSQDGHYTTPQAWVRRLRTLYPQRH